MWRSGQGIPRRGSCRQRHGRWSEQEAERNQQTLQLDECLAVCVPDAFKYSPPLCPTPAGMLVLCSGTLNPTCSTWTSSVWDLWSLVLTTGSSASLHNPFSAHAFTYLGQHLPLPTPAPQNGLSARVWGYRKGPRL